MGKKNNQRDQQKPAAPAVETPVDLASIAGQLKSQISGPTDDPSRDEDPSDTDTSTFVVNENHDHHKEAVRLLETLEVVDHVELTEEQRAGLEKVSQEILATENASGAWPLASKLAQSTPETLAAITYDSAESILQQIQELQPELFSIEGEAVSIKPAEDPQSVEEAANRLAEQLKEASSENYDPEKLVVQMVDPEAVPVVNNDIVEKPLEELVKADQPEEPAPVQFVMDKDPAAYADEVLIEFHDIMTPDQLVAFGEIIRQRNELPSGWTTDECWRFLLFGTSAEPTQNGFWANDPDRYKRPYTEWTAGELAAALTGEIEAPDGVKPEDLGTRLRTLVVGIIGDMEVADWVVDDLVRWALYAEEPKRTTNGVRLRSLRRDRSSPRGWSTDELTAFVLNELPSTDNAQPEELYEQAAERLGASIRFTREDLEAFVRDGTQPERSLFGLLVNDAFRNELPADHWSFLELISAIRGEINIPSNIDVKSAYLKRAGLPEAAAGVLTEQLLKLDKVEIPMAIEFVTNALNQYADKVNLKAAVLPEVGGKAQVGLLRTINKVLRLEGKDFYDGYSQLLAFVAENRAGLFHEHNAFRFVENMNISSTERKQFEALVDMLLHTCRPADRRSADKVVKFDRIAAMVNNDAIMQRLLSYYQG